MAIDAITLKRFSVNYHPPLISFPGFSRERNLTGQKVFAQNGTGKSSLVLSIVGAIPAEIAGSVDLSLEVRRKHTVFELPDIRNKLRVIPQKWKHSILGFSPLDEVTLSSPADTSWRRLVIELLEIADLGETPSAHLSDGEKKRLIICKALACNPELVISDEWCTHLDQDWIRKIEQLFHSFAENGGFHLEFHSSAFRSCVIDEENNGDRPDFFEGQSIVVDGWAGFAESNLVWRYERLRLVINASPKQGIYGNQVCSNAENGDLILIVGKNGSGKSTLLRNLWRGSIFRRLFRVKCPPRMLLIPTDPTYHVVGPLLKHELRTIKDEPPGTDTNPSLTALLRKSPNDDVFAFSFGERKTLAIILGLLSEYPVVMVDEPFAGLDAQKVAVIKEIIRCVQQKGKIIILADQQENVDFYTQKITL